MDEKRLAAKAHEAARHSYSPYSKVSVGAAIESDEGDVYTGCNVENSVFGLTVCAERVALFKGVSAGAKRFRRIAIWSGTGFFLPPCGACRQVLSEWMDAGGKVLLVRSDGERKSHRLADLLPQDLSPLRDHLR